MVVFAINSFSQEFYLNSLDNLIEEIKRLMSEKYEFNTDYHIVCGIGGCKENCLKCEGGIIKIMINKNLSDHNIYSAVEMAYNNKMIPGNFSQHTWMMIHDTTWPHEKTFVERVTRIMQRPLPDGWIFAHTLGLYNLGICSLSFILTRAKDWLGLDNLPKQAGIFLETGRGTIVDDIRLVPLRMYSQLTLAKIDHTGSILNDPLEMDFISLGSVNENNRSKHYVFVASFGMYKLTTVEKTFEVPIWRRPFVASSVSDWRMKMNTSDVWKNHTAFLPLVNVDSNDLTVQKQSSQAPSQVLLA